MKFPRAYSAVFLVGIAAAIGCEGRAPPIEERASCRSPALAEVITEFGDRLQDIALLAPDTLVRQEIREAFTPLVTPSLLAVWLAEPTSAPGREYSSPWPARLEIAAIDSLGPGQCRISADVIYLTSAEVVAGGAAVRIPATLVAQHTDRWRISAYEAEPLSSLPSLPNASPTPDSGAASVPAPESPPANSVEPADSLDREAALEVIRRYFAAISAGNYREAYGLWRGDGSASGQSYEEFAAGFADTEALSPIVGEPGRIEPAAGSRFIEIPVSLRARTSDGGAQHFEGSYIMQRSVVPGSSAQEREWRIARATMRALPN